MSIEKVINNMKPVPFRQQPMNVARIKNPVLQVPLDFIDMDSLYECSSSNVDDTDFIVFKKINDVKIGGNKNA